MKNLNIFSLISEYENAKSRGVLNVPNISFINESGGIIYLPKLEDPYNGYEYVDLGLPSGLKWATCNVGASSPEEYGLYFAWGETVGYTTDDVISGIRVFNEDVYNAGPAASIETDLTLEQDVAHINLGGKWRMPTKVEYQELFDNCNVVWMDDYNGTGVKGRVFTSKVNGKSVFFPAAGYCKDHYLNNESSNYYWSSSCYEGKKDKSYCLYFFNSISPQWPLIRFWGASIRAVCE